MGLDGPLRAGALVIPASEISYRATPAGGPGGQNVNRVSSRVELWWNLETSAAPTPGQRDLLRQRLATRLDRSGWLRLTASASRSQLRNREAVTERFAALLARSVVPPKRRTAPRVPAVEKRRRLETKRHRGDVKRLRGPVRHDD